MTAILDAGAEVFAEKGFEAATMSEIAARSSTAIGSLYRFFPTKAALADALAQRYLGEVGARLDAIEAGACRLAPSAVADALFDLMLDLRRDRVAVVALLDVLGDAADRRTALRETMHASLIAILRSASPPLANSRVTIVAPVLLRLLKCVPTLAGDPTDTQGRLAELRTAIRLYLSDVLGSTGD